MRPKKIGETITVRVPRDLLAQLRSRFTELRLIENDSEVARLALKLLLEKAK